MAPLNPTDPSQGIFARGVVTANYTVVSASLAMFRLTLAQLSWTSLDEGVFCPSSSDAFRGVTAAAVAVAAVRCRYAWPPQQSAV